MGLEVATMRKTRGPKSWWGVAVVALGAVALVAASTAIFAQKADQAEALLQAARAKHVVEGKLDEAVAIYRDVLARYGTNRPVAARALVGLGQCYEKLGAAQVAEARKVYERIVQQYPEQTDLVTQARARLAVLAAAAGGAATPVGSTLAVRRVWADMDGMDVTGKVSPDGRYVSTTHWSTGGTSPSATSPVVRSGI